MRLSRQSSAVILLALAGCYSPNVPLDSDAGGTTPQTSSTASTGETSGATTAPVDTATGGSSSGQNQGSSEDTSPTDSGPADTSGGTSTGAIACDPLADDCPDGTLCDGRDCVEPPDGMVAVPGGPFLMGCNDAVDSECVDDEYPYHEVVISSFALDRTEVRAADYATCVQAGQCSPTSDLDAYGGTCTPAAGNLPAVCVDWFRARDFCEWREARLPTEAEWEKAARGDDGRLYPWGNDAPTCAHAHLVGDGQCVGTQGSLPVGSKPAGASPYGALDMAGNVLEWTSDWYDSAYYVVTPDQDPSGPADGAYKSVRSASWNYNLAFGARTSLRTTYFEVPVPDGAAEHIGFRCAASP